MDKLVIGHIERTGKLAYMPKIVLNVNILRNITSVFLSPSKNFEHSLQLT